VLLKQVRKVADKEWAAKDKRYGGIVSLAKQVSLQILWVHQMPDTKVHLRTKGTFFKPSARALSREKIGRGEAKD